MEPLRDLQVDRVRLQRDVGRRHHRCRALRRVVRDRHCLLGLGVRRPPLLCTGGALAQLPVVAEQVVEEAVVPLDRVVRPGTFETARDGVVALAGSVAVLPAQALLCERRPFRLVTDVLVGIGRTVGLAERVAAGDQRDGLLVVHRHAAERLADVTGRCHRVGVAVRALRVHVDETHLHRAERVGELAVAAVALVFEPDPLRAPVDVVLRRPDVRTAAAEAERLQTHRLDGAVAGEDQQVGPGDLLAVLLLDRPQQPACLVEADVVGPAVERSEPLRAGAAAASAVERPIGAGGVPGHPDEEPAVVAVVGRPPLLRVGHQCVDVGGQGVEVEAVERRGVVEVVAERIGLRVVLTEDPQVQAVRPPVLVRRDPDRLVRGAHHRARRRRRLVAGGDGAVLFVAHDSPR